MKIHEYQAKELLATRNIPVPAGAMVTTPEQARQAAETIMRDRNCDRVVLKAQIHAGGRGKGTFKGHSEVHGVMLCRSPKEVEVLAAKMLEDVLVTRQTGPEGKKVLRLLVEEALDIKKELYAGIVVDRARQLPVLMVSEAGGMEIEEVAATTPEKIVTVPLEPERGMWPFHARLAASRLGLNGQVFKEVARLLEALGRAFYDLDASLVEINPLVITTDDKAVALDAKVNLDDNAAFRHKEWELLVDPTEEDPAEREGKKWGLSYVALDGNIGCMVNGAGLAMATMDIIKHHGGEPANFLDVGGGAKADQVAAAFKIITRDPKVKVIFINIFGGIMRCDTIAEGVINAVFEVGLTVPLVIRLEGTNVELGRKMLDESGLDVISAADMADGARKAVELAKASA